MGGVGGQDWELDSFHAHCCKEFVDLHTRIYVVLPSI